jgi:hypothetical protein
MQRGLAAAPNCSLVPMNLRRQAMK